MRFFKRVHLEFQNQLGQQRYQEFHNLVKGLYLLPLERFNHYSKWDGSGDFVGFTIKNIRPFECLPLSEKSSPVLSNCFY
jgi:hypothetical protein